MGGAALSLYLIATVKGLWSTTWDTHAFLLTTPVEVLRIEEQFRTHAAPPLSFQQHASSPQPGTEQEGPQ